MLRADDEQRTQARTGPAIDPAVADELLIVDSGSDDRTLEIAGKFGARVLNRPFVHFRGRRVFAEEHCEKVGLYTRLLAKTFIGAVTGPHYSSCMSTLR